jgi:5'(3')-deoxyribonucleotidase
MYPFVLGLDLDGVCADYTGGFRRHVAAALGVPPSSLPDPVSWDWTECDWGIGSHEQYLRLHAAAVAQGLFRELEPLPGVRDGLWRLSHAGVRIRVITHRLFVSGSHAASAADTVAWLEDHDLPYWDLCFVADKPQVGADLYIDDSPANIEAFQAAGSDVLIFDQPYNRHLQGPRVRTWAEAAAAVLAHRSATSQDHPARQGRSGPTAGRRGDPDNGAGGGRRTTPGTAVRSRANP